MLTELFALQIALIMKFMDDKDLKLTEPHTWNLDNKAHPGPPVTVFDASVDTETVIIVDRDTARCKITWHPATPDTPKIEWDGAGGMTNMTVLRALNHALAEQITNVKFY